MGYRPADVTLVLNRADTHVGISASDVEAVLGRQPDVRVPSDRAIPRAITAGQPIVVAGPRSRAAVAFTALAARYVTAPAPAGNGAEPAGGRRRLRLRRNGG
jgi:MinD-like ATPase involved in chromosome partitioning or flagellar assembly